MKKFLGFRIWDLGFGICIASLLLISCTQKRKFISQNFIELPFSMVKDITVEILSFEYTSDWSQLKVVINNPSERPVEVKLNNIFLINKEGKLIYPYQPEEVSQKITAKARRFTTLSVLPFIGAGFALAHIMTESKAKTEIERIIDTDLQSGTLPPRTKIWGYVFYPPVEYIRGVLAFIYDRGEPLRFQLDLDKKIEQAKIDEKIQDVGKKSVILKAEKDDKTLYQESFQQMQNKDYQLAILGFNLILQKYPDSDLADNAQYWIGECYYAQGNYPVAIQEFNKVSKNFSISDKSADAILKIGYSLMKLSRKEEAVKLFHRVISSYPKTNSALLAEKKLKELGIDHP